jgi:hypothetical protein
VLLDFAVIGTKMVAATPVNAVIMEELRESLSDTTIGGGITLQEHPLKSCRQEIVEAR